MVDLRTCKPGDRLLSSHGLVLTYVGPMPEGSDYEHEVMYPNGARGTRCNDGFVFLKNRIPEADHDIVEILK